VRSKADDMASLISHGTETKNKEKIPGPLKWSTDNARGCL